MGIANIETALVVAPHADDETFGCGGTIAKLSNQGVRVDLLLGTLGYDQDSFLIREKEMLHAMLVMNMKTWSLIRAFEEGRMDQLHQVVMISAIEEFIEKNRYDVVFIPYPSHHQDHIVMHQACMAALRPGTFQPKMVLMYEYTYPTWEVPDQYNGRFFVDITDTFETKKEALLAYKTQLRDDHSPVSVGAVTIMAMARGLSIGVNMAEMFYVIQMRNII